MENLKRSKSLFGDIVGAIILLGVSFLLLWMMISKVFINHSSRGVRDYESYELVSSSNQYDLLDDSVTKLENDLNQLKARVERKKTNLIRLEGVSTNAFGISFYTDTVQKNRKIFIELLDFGLNQNNFDYDNSSKYYFKDGISYLRLPQVTKMDNHHYKLYYINKKVDYRYDSERNVILIPLMSNSGVLLVKIFWFLVVLIVTFIFIFGMLLILKFLIRISRNSVFEAINIRRLFWISICCFTSVLIPYVISGLLYLLYAKTLSAEVIYTKKVSAADISLVMLGVLFIALYAAFKKGFKLKQENDLTI